MIRRWLHSECHESLQTLHGDRDRLESDLGSLRRSHESLRQAYESLLLAIQSKSQMDTFAKMLGEMFTEEEVAEDQKQWLTLAFEDREGVTSDG